MALFFVRFDYLIYRIPSSYFGIKQTNICMLTYITADWFIGTWSLYCSFLSITCLSPGKCSYVISLVASRHLFGHWLGTIGKKAITWTTVDHNIRRHMPSKCHNGLITLNSNQLESHPTTSKSNRATGVHIPRTWGSINKMTYFLHATCCDACSWITMSIFWYQNIYIYIW